MSMKDDRKTADLEAKIVNKKIGQKMRLLLANPNFRQDIVSVRKKFKELHIGAMEVDKEISAYREKYPRKRVEEAKEVWPIIINHHRAKDKNPDIRPTILSIVKKYELKPIKYWEQQIDSLVFHHIFSFAQANAQLEHLGIGAHDFIDPRENLDSQNFTIWTDDKMGLSLQIFNDTSLDDIKKGWKFIERARTFYFGRARFYPLKNINIAGKLFALDTNTDKLSDWEKQEKIFGEIRGTNFGPIEKKRRKKIQNTRSRYRKRFGSKS